jgi:hypothetical protein
MRSGRALQQDDEELAVQEFVNAELARRTASASQHRVLTVLMGHNRQFRRTDNTKDLVAV